MRRSVQVLVVTSALGLVAGACAKSSPDAGTTPGVSTTVFTVPGLNQSSTTAPDADPTTEPTTTTAEPPFSGGSTAPKSGLPVGNRLALLSSVRVGGRNGYDRVVFEFENEALPLWAVKYVQPPFTEDASGVTIPVVGESFLAVNMVGASGFDPNSVTISYQGPAAVPRGSARRVTVVQRTGDFESQLGWVIGLEKVEDFKVSTLTNPARIVIDISQS